MVTANRGESVVSNGFSAGVGARCWVGFGGDDVGNQSCKGDTPHRLVVDRVVEGSVVTPFGCTIDAGGCHASPHLRRWRTDPIVRQMSRQLISEGVVNNGHLTCRIVAAVGRAAREGAGCGETCSTRGAETRGALLGNGGTRRALHVVRLDRLVDGRGWVMHCGVAVIEMRCRGGHVVGHRAD